MIQPGERFDVQGKTLEAVATTRENGCNECAFNAFQGCMDPMHDHDCYDLTANTYVIFKEVEDDKG